MENQNSRKLAQEMKKEVNLEDILERRGMLTKEFIWKNLIENSRVKQTTKVVLGILLFAGAAGTAIVAPNLFSVMGAKRYGFKKYRASDVKKFKNTFYQLKNRKLAYSKEGRGARKELGLTQEGYQAALKTLFENYYIQKPDKWDGVWRVVIFDVPTSKNRFRDILRERLENMGFLQMQKSVFVSPYECKNELDLICEVYDLWDHVNYFEALNIDNEGELRRSFGL